MGSRWPPSGGSGSRGSGYRPDDGPSYQGASYPSYGSNAPPPPPVQFGSGGGDYRAASDRYIPDRRGDSRRDSYSDARGDYGQGYDQFRPPQGDFTFRADRPAGVQDSFNSHRNLPPRRRFDNDGGDSYRPNRQPAANGRGPPGARRSRGGYQRGGAFSRKAADRAFLHKKHDENVEELLGDTTGKATYRDVDGLTDSDEAEMDISGESGSDEDAPARKRARLTDDQPVSTPKWSNPDPYTALPPPDETQRKKKDVVQMIRKARVEADAKKGAGDSEAADFISFDFSDDEADDSGKGQGVPGAPSGPRSAFTGLPPRPEVSLFPPHTPVPTGSTTASSKNPQLAPSAGLGSRKRTADDKIKRPHQPLQKGKKMKPDGFIDASWLVKPNEVPCPWVDRDHSSEPSMGVRLHKELCDFYEYVRPRDYEEHVRKSLINKLGSVIKMKWNNANVKPFGSFMSGLYLPTADMDVVVCSSQFMNGSAPMFSTKSHLFKTRDHLIRHGIPHGGDVEVISGAKVPLVKYIDEATGLRVDISFENLTGTEAINTFLDWKDQYPAMPKLVAIIKHYLSMRGLNEPANGGIGGFSVICMVVNLFNNWPAIQSGTMNPEHHLGETLMEFFRMYGYDFDFETTAISMNPPRFIPKHSVTSIFYKNMERLSIIDPNRSDNDISGGSSNFPLVQRCFQSAYDTLRRRMDGLAKHGNKVHGYNTILAPLLGGNYSSFRLQREYLKAIYEGKSLTPQTHRRGDRW